MTYSTITKKKVYQRQEIVVNGKRYLRESMQEDDNAPRISVSSNCSVSELERELEKFSSAFDGYLEKPQRPMIPEHPKTYEKPKAQRPVVPQPQRPEKPNSPYRLPEPKSGNVLAEIAPYVQRDTSLERRLHDRYDNRFKKTFSTCGIDNEYVPIYRVKQGRDPNISKFRNQDTVAFYASPDDIAILRSDVPDSFQMTAVVHETVHHNLHKLKNKKGLDQKELFIEEGFTEFLTEQIMGESDYGRTKSSSIQNKCDLFEYEVGANFFKQIHQKKGITGAFEAYLFANKSADLMKYMLSIGIKQAEFFCKH